MKDKRSARSARTTAKNIHISQGGRDLTAQAGLISVVKFLKNLSKSGGKLNQNIQLQDLGSIADFANPFRS